MKFKNLLLVTFLITPILAGCSNNPTSNKIEEEIFYISNNGRNIDVFNIDELYFSEEGVGYLNRRDYEYGEFGGQIEFCSNEEFYCLAGGLNVAVPKNKVGQKEWQYEGRNCQAKTALSDQQITE